MPVSGNVRGAIGSISFEKNVSLAAREKKTVVFDKNSFRRSEYPLQAWWPNGYGEPTLQTLNLKFEMPDHSLSDSKTVRFGIRKVTYDTTYNALKILVNGVPIFCRGEAG